MNDVQMIEIVEQFSRKIDPVEGQVKVTQLPDFKTVYVETIDEIGRSIILREFKVDGKTYWAGYSQRTETVFVSQASRE
jgi:hypothetical protein